jgi:hypothetical protein
LPSRFLPIIIPVGREGGHPSIEYKRNIPIQGTDDRRFIPEIMRCGSFS